MVEEGRLQLHCTVEEHGSCEDEECTCARNDLREGGGSFFCKPQIDLTLLLASVCAHAGTEKFRRSSRKRRQWIMIQMQQSPILNLTMYVHLQGNFCGNNRYTIKMQEKTPRSMAHLENDAVPFGLECGIGEGVEGGFMGDGRDLQPQHQVLDAEVELERCGENCGRGTRRREEV